MILSGIRSKLAAESSVMAVVPAKRVFIGMALRESARPYIVIHGINLPEAAVTLDGSSALHDGEIQFDCYADTAVDARELLNTVKAAVQDFGGPLPGGSTIQFLETTLDTDDSFELGGSSFLFRSLFRKKAFYTEA